MVKSKNRRRGFPSSGWSRELLSSLLLLSLLLLWGNPNVSCCNQMACSSSRERLLGSGTLSGVRLSGARGLTKEDVDCCCCCCCNLREEDAVAAVVVVVVSQEDDTCVTVAAAAAPVKNKSPPLEDDDDSE